MYRKVVRNGKDLWCSGTCLAVDSSATLMSRGDTEAVYITAHHFHCCDLWLDNRCWTSTPQRCRWWWVLSLSPCSTCCQAAGEFTSSGPGHSVCRPKLQMKYWDESFFTSTSLWEKWNVAPLFCLFSLWTTCWPSCDETAMWSLLISIFLSDCLCQSAQSCCQQGSAIKVLLLLLEGCQNRGI